MKYDEENNMYTFEILVIGGKGTGKNCLVRRYTYDDYSDSYITNLDYNFKNKLTKVSDQPITQSIWVIPATNNNKYDNDTYQDYDGIIVCVDVTNSSSLKDAELLLMQSVLADKPAVVVGTKIDDENKRIINAGQLINLANKKTHIFGPVETSAKNSIKVDECFNLITKEIIQTNKFKRLNPIESIEKEKVVLKQYLRNEIQRLTNEKRKDTKKYRSFNSILADLDDISGHTAMKYVIQAVKNVANEHYNPWYLPTGFFSFNLFRNTTSYNRLIKLLDKNSNIKIEESIVNEKSKTIIEYDLRN
jgi:Ras-related protein Rab-8A